MITAPDVEDETVVTDTFGLVQEGVAWFGPDDIEVSVRVTPRPAGGTDPGTDPGPDPGIDPGDGPDLGADPTDPDAPEVSEPAIDASSDDAALHGACAACPTAPDASTPWLVWVLAGLLGVRARRRSSAGRN
jgi:hypothetical protein